MLKSNNIFLAILAIICVGLAFIAPTFIPISFVEKSSYALLGLAGSVITYGVLGATGNYSSNKFKLGGSAAVWAAIFLLLASTKLPVSPYATQKLELIVQLPAGVECSGQVSLKGVNLAINQVSLNNTGFISFSDIPMDYKNVRVEIKIAGYKSVSRSIPLGARRNIVLTSREMEKEISDGIPFSLNFEDPIIESPKKTLTGLVERPKLQFPFYVKGKGDLPQSSGVDLRLTRIRDGEMLRSKKSDIKIVNPGNAGWSIDIDTGQIIPENSFGRYKAELMAWNGPHKTLEWNYLYSAPFNDLAKTFEYLDNKDKVHSRDREAMVIINDSSKRGFVTVRAKIEFDFKYDFCIRGRYRIGHRKGMESDNPALDVGVGLSSGDILSFIMGAEGGRAFLIKKTGEEEIKASLSEGGNKLVYSDPIIDMDEKRQVHFAILFASAGNSMLKCSIFCSDNSITEFENETPRITRMLPRGILGSAKTRVSLRLWQAGWVDIEELEIADITKAPMGNIKNDFGLH